MLVLVIKIDEEDGSEHGRVKGGLTSTKIIITGQSIKGVILVGGRILAIILWRRAGYC